MLTTPNPTRSHAARRLSALSSEALDATAHFFFIERHHARREHLRSEVAKPTLPAKVQVEIIEGSFVDEFPV